jgi:hypothetical protein
VPPQFEQPRPRKNAAPSGSPKNRRVSGAASYSTRQWHSRRASRCAITPIVDAETRNGSMPLISASVERDDVVGIGHRQRERLLMNAIGTTLCAWTSGCGSTESTRGSTLSRERLTKSMPAPRLVWSRVFPSIVLSRAC